MAPNSTHTEHRWEKWFPLLALVVFAAVLVVGGMVVVVPQYDHLQHTREHVYSQNVSAVNEREMYIADVEEIASRYADIDQRTYRVMDRIIPPAQNTSLLFEELDRFFSDSDLQLVGVTVTSGGSVATSQTDASEAAEDEADNGFDFGALSGDVPVETVIESSDVETIQLSLNIVAPSGSYEEFKQMLEVIEAYPRVMDLASISFTAGTDAYTLVINTYQQPSAVAGQ